MRRKPERRGDKDSEEVIVPVMVRQHNLAGGKGLCFCHVFDEGGIA